MSRIEEVTEDLSSFCKVIDDLQERAEFVLDVVENELATPENNYEAPLEPADKENFLRLRRLLTLV